MQSCGSAPLSHPRHIAHGGAAFEVEANDRGETEFWTKLVEGRWEPDTLALIAAHVDGETLFLDVGAWIGPTALYAAALGAAAIAVEADPKALPALRRNIALNPSLAGRIEVVAKALYPAAGTVRFGSRRKGGDSMSSLVHDRMATAWEVETITPERLAELCRGARKVFMKVDIEGGEYTIFPGAAALFALPFAAIHFSLHPQFVLGESRGSPGCCAGSVSRAIRRGFSAAWGTCASSARPAKGRCPPRWCSCSPRSGFACGRFARAGCFCRG